MEMYLKMAISCSDYSALRSDAAAELVVVVEGAKDSSNGTGPRICQGSMRAREAVVGRHSRAWCKVGLASHGQQQQQRQQQQQQQQ
jgi:hypothetical protein